MAISRLDPPLPLANAMVTHTIVIYGQELVYEIEKFKAEIFHLVDEDPTKDLPLAIRAKVLMGITHELVHMLATDEHKPIMPLLGLDLLELLTDSIALDLHFDRYSTESPVIQTGIADGIAYITNVIRRENGLKDAKTHQNLMKLRSFEIIKECRSIINK